MTYVTFKLYQEQGPFRLLPVLPVLEISVRDTLYRYTMLPPITIFSPLAHTSHSHGTPCSCFLTKDGPLAVNARLSRSNYHVLNCAECTTAATALKSDMAVSSSEPRTHDEPNRL